VQIETLRLFIYLFIYLML